MNKKPLLLLLSLFILLCLQLNASAEDYIISGSGHNYPAIDEVGSMGVYVPSPSLDGWLRYYYPGMNLISTSITNECVKIIEKNRKLIERCWNEHFGN